MRHAGETRKETALYWLGIYHRMKAIVYPLAISGPRGKEGELREVTIRIPIEPQPKGRPKFTTIAGHPHAYTPKKTLNYESQISDLYKQLSGRFYIKKPQAIHVAIMFGMPIPMSTPKKNRPLMIADEIKHVKKGDIDNLAKSVLDALNGIAWEDDSQIVSLNLKKFYAEEPHIYLIIREV